MARFRKKRGPSAKIGVVQLLIGTALFIALVQFVIATSSRTAEIARISKVPDARKEVRLFTHGTLMCRVMPCCNATGGTHARADGAQRLPSQPPPCHRDNSNKSAHTCGV